MTKTRIVDYLLAEYHAISQQYAKAAADMLRSEPQLRKCMLPDIRELQTQRDYIFMICNDLGIINPLEQTNTPA